MAVALTRTELGAAELRAAAARSKDAAASRRLLAIALVMEGSSRIEAARSTGMDRQTLRDWVHRYNESGLTGLENRRNPGGPPRKLTAEQEASIAEWVRQGPPAGRKLVRWRLLDLRDEIAQQFGVQLHERTIGKLMLRLNFSRVSVRPRHPEQDAAAQEAHKKTSPSWWLRRSRSTPATASRALVAGRSAGRPARQPDLYLGGVRQPPARAARSTLRLDLHLRRGLPRARRRRRPGIALRQYRRNEPASR